MLKPVEDAVPFNRRMWRNRLYALLSILVGVWIFVMLGLYVAQVHLLQDLNSSVYFSQVVDQMDKDADDLSYEKFVFAAEDLQNAKIWSFYVFDLRNSVTAIEEGQKPYIEEQGPYAYRRVTGKWDVQFDEQSHSVSYKEWGYLEPVDPTVCDMLHFRLNVPDYANECAGDGCLCRDDSEAVRVFNIHYLWALLRYGTDGIMGVFAQKVFETQHEILLTTFLDYCNVAALPITIRNVIDYQQDLATLRVLGEAVEYNVEVYGLDQTISSFHGGQDDEVVLDCGPFNWRGKEHCSWSTSSFLDDIVRLAQLNTTLYLTTTQSQNLLNSSVNGSIAFEHTGYPLWTRAARHLGYLAHSVAREVSDADAFEQLSLRLCEWLGAPAPNGFEKSLCDSQTEAVAQWIYLPRYGWRTREVVNNDVMAVMQKATVNTLPCDEFGTMCSWEINSWVGGNMSLALAEALLSASGDATVSVASNDSSADLHLAKHYCELPDAEARNCSRLDVHRELALETLPRALALAEGVEAPTAEQLAFYRNMTCSIGEFMGQFYNHSFARTRLVGYVNDAYTGPAYTFDPDRLEDLAYGQWAGGYTTQALDGSPSAYNVIRFEETYYVSEFYGQALMAGYGDMRMSIDDGRALLQALANSTELCAYIMRRQSVFEGDGSVIIDGLGLAGDRGFIEENVYADFSDSPFDLGPVLDLSVNSSAAQCENLQLSYERCADMSDTRLANCRVWETTETSQRSGISCDATSVDENTHPYALKRGNIVARMIFNFTTNYVFKEQRYWCADPERCDYLRGGIFVESTVRNVLFEGYVDPIVAALQAIELERDLNVTLACLQPQRQDLWFDCVDQWGLDFKCVEDGYTLWHEGRQLLAVDRWSLNRELWYAKDIFLEELNATIANPVFAHVPGMLWTNVTFQQRQACDAPEFSSCTSREQTGRNDLGARGNLVQFLGNDTVALDFDPVEVRGNARFEAEPQLYDGFDMEGVGAIWGFWEEARTPLRMRLIPQTRSDILSRVVQYLPGDRHYDQEDIIIIPVGRFEAVLDDLDAMNEAMAPTLLDLQGFPYAQPAGMRFAVQHGTHRVPGFVGAPHHYWNEKAGSDEYFQVQGLIGERERHEFFIDIDPVTGQPLRFAERSQWAFRVEISALYPILNTFQGRCTSPGRDEEGRVGCGMFAPIYWVQKAHIIEPDLALAFQDEILFRPTLMEITFYGAVALCGLFGLLGACLLGRTGLAVRSRNQLIHRHELARIARLAKEKAAALEALEAEEAAAAGAPSGAGAGAGDGDGDGEGGGAAADGAAADGSGSEGSGSESD